MYWTNINEKFVVCCMVYRSILDRVFFVCFFIHRIALEWGMMAKMADGSVVASVSAYKITYICIRDLCFLTKTGLFLFHVLCLFW